MINKQILAMIGALLVLSVTGCNSSGSSGGTAAAGGGSTGTATGAKGGCLMSATMCIDYEVVYVSQGDLQTICAQSTDSTFHDAGCPSTSRVGRCRATTESGVSITHYYTPVDAAAIQVACESGGHEFTAN